MPTRKFPGRFDSLVPISDFIAQAAEQAGFDVHGIYAVRLAVDEACSNIIEHGYQGEERGKIECTYDVLADGLKITLRDQGRAFDPASIPDPDFDVALEDLEPRGAGLFLIRQIMDEVQFTFDNQLGNTLVMVKYL
ncbi:MAG: ATP-binding protein [Anaerolineales bacterium]|nr:ATP-binding protein [Anaerolineales bacterium]